MAITYAKNSCLVKTPPQIEILGRLYTLLQIGNIEIMASDLTGRIGSQGDTSDCYYRSDLDKWFYYGDSMKSNYLAPYRSAGWRFFESSAMSAIFTALGGNTAANAQKLLGYFDETWAGNNQTGMNLLPYGALSNRGASEGYGTQARYIPNDTYGFNISLNNDGTLNYSESPGAPWFGSIRLYRTIS